MEKKVEEKPKISLKISYQSEIHKLAEIPASFKELISEAKKIYGERFNENETYYAWLVASNRK